MSKRTCENCGETMPADTSPMIRWCADCRSKAMEARRLENPAPIGNRPSNATKKDRRPEPGSKKKRPDFVLPYDKKDGLNELEYGVKKNYEAKGYRVLRTGWPDFVMVAPDGSVLFVEVKSFGGRLSQKQIEMREILEKFGEYKVERPKGGDPN